MTSWINIEDRADRIDAEAEEERVYLRTLELLDEPSIPLGDQRGLANPVPPELRERAS